MAYTLGKRMDEKRKRVLEDHAMDSDDEYYEIVLNFHVQRGEGIDEPRPLHSLQTRYYRVYAWIHPCDEEQASSRWIKGNPNPLWNTVFTLPWHGFEPSGKNYLHLEVVKYEKGSQDPEPSCGEVLVGRTRIHLPDDLTQVKSGPYQLVKLHDDNTTKPAGYIIVSDIQLNEEYY